MAHPKLGMLRRRWLHFWFEPVSPTNLCVSRMLLFGLMFLFYLTVDFGSYATEIGRASCRERV